MRKSNITRREFTKLTSAAFSGIVAGSVIGCGGQDGAGDGGKKEGEGAKKEEDGHDHPAILAEKHACRGLNSCKGQGAGGANDCAGQGTCATAKHHDCAGTNDCKGQGGCGEKPAQNDCKGKGKCGVPIKKPDVWQKARDAFETAYKAEHKKDAGASPAAPAGS